MQRRFSLINYQERFTQQTRDITLLSLTLLTIT